MVESTKSNWGRVLDILFVDYGAVVAFGLVSFDNSQNHTLSLPSNMRVALIPQLSGNNNRITLVLFASNLLRMSPRPV